MADQRAGADRRLSSGRRLTDRQATVLEHVAAGLENKEIARRLGISEQAAKEHVSVLLRILAAPNRAALADAAAMHRFVGTFDIDPDWLRFLFQDAPVHISVLKGPDHRFVALNGAYRASSPGPSAIGRPYIEVFPERSDGLALLDEAYRTERPVTRADVPRRFVRRPNGPPEDGFISLAIQPLPDASGKTAGLAVFSIDVTDTVRARQRLAELERDQLAVLDLLTTGVVVIDEHGYLVKANAAARSLLSLPVAPVQLTPDLASHYQVRDASDDRAITFDEIPTVRAMRGEHCADPYLYRVRDPELRRDRLLRVSARPLLRNDGSLRGSVTTLTGG